MKYKLVKKYPGSPELGTIIYEAHDSLWFYERPNNEFLKHAIKVIKDNPEFWQPIIEYDTEWGNALIGNLIAISTHIKNKSATPEMANRLQEYATELFNYFEDKLK